MGLARIEEAIRDYREGKFVIIVDDEDRENEGDLCLAAEWVTPDAINFMAREGRGLICLPLTGDRLDELEIPLMVPPDANSSGFGTAFTVSIEARHGVTTGISAYDRAATIRAAIDPATRPQDLARPGHVFPLRARPGGVLERAGQTEASVDLARLAGLYPAAVICEIMADDGTMMRLPDLEVFADRHGIKIISVADLIAYRKKRERLARRTDGRRLQTRYGEFTALSYRNDRGGDDHVVLTLGDLAWEDAPLARIHSECLTGDVFGSLRCDCGDQLDLAMRRVAAAGAGILLYLRQEGRGIGLHNKLRAYALQDQGYDTVEANRHLGFADDLRDYGVAAQILRDLGLDRVKLLTNNPDKVAGLETAGIWVVDRVPILAPVYPENLKYLEVKREKMGHVYDAVDQISRAIGSTI
ncbi:MAG TPA: bifunctional 3,4-dihydroxy-2-butanone-4-phosphate synthase/GTP cyclohydrolase II [Dehalococcoidia bacterium]|nr:bifunctional 3,4-dihydroxy-2-butanone-4-phosphate synthase/GTP cyclohydrolase II [Dehalococcoidia bacterium]